MSPPEPPVPVHCPHCDQLVNYSQARSGNTYDAEFWTDGKMDAPMLPSHFDLIVCPHCDGFFWGSEAKADLAHTFLKRITDDDPFSSEGEDDIEFSRDDYRNGFLLQEDFDSFRGDSPVLFKSKLFEEPDLSYEAWISQKYPFSKRQSEAVWLQAAQTLSHEFYSRTVAWHLANDAFRRSSWFVEYSQAQRENMEKLALYEGDREFAALRQAEIWRNLSEFGRAKEMIEKWRERRSFRGVFMARLIEEKNERVQLFPSKRNKMR